MSSKAHKGQKAEHPDRGYTCLPNLLVHRLAQCGLLGNTSIPWCCSCGLKIFCMRQSFPQHIRFSSDQRKILVLRQFGTGLITEAWVLTLLFFLKLSSCCSASPCSLKPMATPRQLPDFIFMQDLPFSIWVLFSEGTPCPLYSKADSEFRGFFGIARQFVPIPDRFWRTPLAVKNAYPSESRLIGFLSIL